eukprot:3032912-Rhodomonas_salina.2
MFSPAMTARVITNADACCKRQRRSDHENCFGMMQTPITSHAHTLASSARPCSISNSSTLIFFFRLLPSREHTGPCASRIPRPRTALKLWAGQRLHRCGHATKAADMV